MQKHAIFTAKRGQFPVASFLQRCPDLNLYVAFDRILSGEPRAAQEPAERVARQWIGECEIPVAYPQLLLVFPYLSYELQQEVLEGRNFREWLAIFGKDPVRNAAAYVLERSAGQLRQSIALYSKVDPTLSVGVMLEISMVLDRLYGLEGPLRNLARAGFCSLLESGASRDGPLIDQLTDILGHHAASKLLARVEARMQLPTSVVSIEPSGQPSHIPTVAQEAVRSLLLGAPFRHMPFSCELNQEELERTIRFAILGKGNGEYVEFSSLVSSAIDALTAANDLESLKRAYALADAYVPERAASLARLACTSMIVNEVEYLSVPSIADRHGLEDLLVSSLSRMVEQDVVAGSNYSTSYSFIHLHGFASNELLLLSALEEVESVLRGS